MPAEIINAHTNLSSPKPCPAPNNLPFCAAEHWNFQMEKGRGLSEAVFWPSFAAPFESETRRESGEAGQAAGAALDC